MPGNVYKVRSPQTIIHKATRSITKMKSFLGVSSCDFVDEIFILFMAPQRDVMVCYFAFLAVNSTGGRSPWPPSTLRVNLISSPDTLPL